MAVTYRSRFLAAMGQANRRITQLFAELSAGIAGDLARVATAEGQIPRSAQIGLQRRAAERVARMFIGRTSSGEPAPLEVAANGLPIPLSPYTRSLFAAIAAVVALPVEQNAAILARLVPTDILERMRRATDDPFAAARVEVGIAEMSDRAWLAAVAEPLAPPDPVVVAEIELFRPNPLAAYEAPHTWVDPNGYRLSDRIWDTAEATRRKLDLYLADAIRTGKGSLAMSRELEQFLRPDRLPLRTSAPYGTKASYDAMRLARTEITRAHGQAAQVSAAMNPFVVGMKWNLSLSHPRVDICDDYARGGANNDGVYPLDDLPGYPAHPHCVTPGQVVTTLRGDVPIEQIREGDHVLTHMGRYRPVLAAWATPHRGRVYQIQTMSGKLELTGNHPVMLRSGWVNAESIKPGDEILYTGVNIGFDLDISVAECVPALFEQSGIPAGILGGIVPIGAVALDSDPIFGQGVAMPSQAPFHYSKVLSVESFQYTGDVYNMTVMGDHTYTVNGAVTHNCLCYLTNELAENPDFLDRVIAR